MAREFRGNDKPFGGIQIRMCSAVSLCIGGINVFNGTPVGSVWRFLITTSNRR